MLHYPEASRSREARKFVQKTGFVGEHFAFPGIPRQLCLGDFASTHDL